MMKLRKIFHQLSRDFDLQKELIERKQYEHRERFAELKRQFEKQDKRVEGKLSRYRSK